MKVEENLNKIIVYIIDNTKYNKESSIKELLIDIFNDLSEFYNIEFNDSYNLNLYINKYYGMILEIEKNDIIIDEDNIVNLKLNILRDTLFLYQVDDPLDYINYEIYYYENKFYVNIKKLDINLLENSNLIYGDSVYKIIGRGIKL